MIAFLAAKKAERSSVMTTLQTVSLTRTACRHFYVFTFIGTGLLCSLSGCGLGVTNPSFAIKPSKARQGIQLQQEQRPTLARPLLLLSGYTDVGIEPYLLKEKLGKIFPEDRIIGMNFFTTLTYDECRAHVLEMTNEAFPSSDPQQTVEVDVIAHSMGGLISRYAAMDIPGKQRLRIKRLFTISTPHQGAVIAMRPTLDSRLSGMRSHSDFLESLDKAFGQRDYELICYTRLGDTIVLPSKAAPPGYPLWWIPDLPLSKPHLDAPKDPRILLDIVLRLREQQPVTIEPAAPVPS
jgi:hypothetical protein